VARAADDMAPDGKPTPPGETKGEASPEGVPRAGRSRQGRLQRQALKVVVGTLALLPAARTGFRFLTDRLGANPIAEAMNQLGYWTLVLLVVTLAGCGGCWDFARFSRAACIS
jgi:hypothetical protein